jgi:hypothetical protein
MANGETAKWRGVSMASLMAAIAWQLAAAHGEIISKWRWREMAKTWRNGENEISRSE